MEQIPNNYLGDYCRLLSITFPYDIRVSSEPFMLPAFAIFQGKFHGNPMHVAVVISNCLREERRILAAANMPIQVTFSDP